jgi:hypothetical protein
MQTTTVKLWFQVFWNFPRYWTLFLMKTAVFWVVAPCSLVEVCQCFRVSCCLHHQDDELLITLMEAARSSEMLANFYQTTRRYNPDDSHLRTHRHENLKSYCFLLLTVMILYLVINFCLTLFIYMCPEFNIFNTTSLEHFWTFFERSLEKSI